ncbi:MAG: hypothetical protein ABEJ79_08360 [Halolamina sp.]
MIPNSFDDATGPGRAGPWYRLVKPTATSLAATLLVALYVLLSGAPTDGVAAVVAVVAGGTTVLLAVAMAGFYVLDAL